MIHRPDLSPWIVVSGACATDLFLQISFQTMTNMARNAFFVLSIFIKVSLIEGTTEAVHNWTLVVNHDSFFTENSTQLETTQGKYETIVTGINEEFTRGEINSSGTVTEVMPLNNSSDLAEDNQKDNAILLQAISHVRFGMSVVGITGNIINIAVCLQPNFRQLPVTPYMVALAVADSIGLYSSAFVVALKTFTGQTVPGLTQFCNVRRYLNVVSLCTSALLLCAISIQRMIAIRYPLHAKLWLKKGAIYCSLAAIILYATASFIPVILSFTTQCGLKPGWQRIYVYKILTYHLLVSNNLLPDVILVISNTLLAISVKNTLFRKDNETAVHGRKGTNVNKCAVMALTLAAAHLLLTTPLTVYSIVDALDIYSDTGPTDELIQSSVYLLYTANHAVNFFLCVATSSSFRQSLKSLLSCQKCRRKQTIENANSSETISTALSHMEINP